MIDPDDETFRVTPPSGNPEPEREPKRRTDPAIPLADVEDVRERSSSRMSGGQGRGAIRSYDDEQLEKAVEAVRERFTYQPLRDGDAELYTKIAGPLRDLAELLVRTCPAGRELSTALTHLAECRMHANASIALRGTKGA